MADYWQITLAELDREAVQPIRKMFHIGVYYFECPICSETVGIWRDPNFDRISNGMMYRREECKHGHVINWENIKEAQ